MARDIICDLCQAAVATWLEGNLKTGEQTGLCDGCWVAWTLGRLDADLGAEAKEAIAARWGPQVSPAGAEGGGGLPKPKSGRPRPGRPSQRTDDGRSAVEEELTKPAADKAGDQEPDSRLAQAPAAADDG